MSFSFSGRSYINRLAHDNYKQVLLLANVTMVTEQKKTKPTTAPLPVVNGKTKRKVVFCLGNSMLERRLSIILNCYCLLTTSRKVLSYRTLLLLPIPAVMASTTTLLRKCMLPRCTAKHTLHTLFSPSFDSFILSILMQKRA